MFAGDHARGGELDSVAGFFATGQACGFSGGSAVGVAGVGDGGSRVGDAGQAAEGVVVKQCGAGGILNTGGKA